MSYEAELVALAVLLFLYDSTVLLYADEVILTCGRGREWRVSTGLRGFLVSGRRVCFLSPLALFRPSVRLRWNPRAAGQAGGDASWSQKLPGLARVSPWTMIAGIGLFVLLPLGLFTPLGVLAVIPAVAFIYGGILAALLVVRWRCELPVLSRTRFAGLVFECLACPPFGVNLVRHCSLMSGVEEPLTIAAGRLLKPGQLNVLGVHCQAILDEELLQLGDDASRRSVLERQRAQFGAWIQSV